MRIKWPFLSPVGVGGSSDNLQDDVFSNGVKAKASTRLGPSCYDNLLHHSKHGSLQQAEMPPGCTVAALECLGQSCLGNCVYLFDLISTAGQGYSPCAKSVLSPLLYTHYKEACLLE